METNIRRIAYDAAQLLVQRYLLIPKILIEMVLMLDPNMLAIQALHGVLIADSSLDDKIFYTASPSVFINFFCLIQC